MLAFNAWTGSLRLVGDFYSELKRRNVVRVGIAYAVAGGLIIEVLDIMLCWIETQS